MKYAIIRLQGKQYKVKENDEFVVDKLNSNEPAAEILLVSDGEEFLVGKPILDKAKVGLKVVNDFEKGVKIDVLKYKAKSRYRKKIGFRPHQTRLLVEKISIK